MRLPHIVDSACMNIAMHTICYTAQVLGESSRKPDLIVLCCCSTSLVRYSSNITMMLFMVMVPRLAVVPICAVEIPLGAF